jgi:hypothetical protein
MGMRKGDATLTNPIDKKKIDFIRNHLVVSPFSYGKFLIKVKPFVVSLSNALLSEAEGLRANG